MFIIYGTKFGKDHLYILKKKTTKRSTVSLHTTWYS